MTLTSTTAGGDADLYVYAADRVTLLGASVEVTAVDMVGPCP